MQFFLRQLSIGLEQSEDDVLQLAKKKIEAVCGRNTMRTASVYKRSVDARHKERIRLVYTVLCEVEANEATVQKLHRSGIEPIEQSEPICVKHASAPLSARPVVVGFGPAGMFCALLLAQNGYRPIVIERGGDVLQRTKFVAEFVKSGRLDPDNNVQFGAGGAGTFSDGKLVTRIHDPLCRYVLEQLHAFGAPDEVLTYAKPHIGTDLLRQVVCNIEQKILELGGEIRYHTKLTGLLQNGQTLYGVQTEQGEIACGAAVLAIGHSARDVYAFLQRDGYLMQPKPFSVGVRIEHLQSEIDRALYGDAASDVRLRHAEYALSHHQKDSAGIERCVYSFCMCPGGTVMASASEQGGVVTNGMSEYARDGKNANAALVVSVTPEDCARAGTDGVGFQRMLEQAAFRAGAGEYRAPVQTVGNFLSRTNKNEPTTVLPTYRDGAVTPCDLHTILPDYVTQMLACGLQKFNRTIEGFADFGALLTGTETRTSSPLRILRNAQTYTAPTCKNLYPCGEGAGYAGGITSAAVDGLRCALALMEQYAPTKAE